MKGDRFRGPPLHAFGRLFARGVYLCAVFVSTRCCCWHRQDNICTPLPSRTGLKGLMSRFSRCGWVVHFMFSVHFFSLVFQPRFESTGCRKSPLLTFFFFFFFKEGPS